MAIIKASYTKKLAAAKANIRYIQHRPGRNGESRTRTLFSSDGALGRWQAYGLIETAAQGSLFYRIVVSPDPAREDTNKDVFLREITEQTMQCLAERVEQPIEWVAAEHDDHASHRHVHILAIVPRRLQRADFQVLRETATAACLAQRQERDMLREQQKEQGEEAGWE